MSGTTPTQSLAYATGGDLLVADGDALTSLAERTDARLDQQDANLAVVQVPPFTVLESKVATLLPGQYTPWPFDTVLVDTQDGSDLAEDPYSILCRRTGYWMVGAYIDTLGAVGSISTMITLNVNVNNPSSGITLGTVTNTQWDNGNGFHLGASTVAKVTDATKAKVIMEAIVSGSTGVTFPNAVVVTWRRMWAYWLGDL